MKKNTSYSIDEQTIKEVEDMARVMRRPVSWLISDSIDESMKRWRIHLEKIKKQGVMI